MLSTAGGAHAMSPICKARVENRPGNADTKMDTKIHTLGALCGNGQTRLLLANASKADFYSCGCVDQLKTRYRLIHRGRGTGIFYCVDSKTGKRTSLGKATGEEGLQIVAAKNQAERCSTFNSAKAHLAGTDADIPKRTWQHALEVLTETKRGANKECWKRVAKDRALPLLWPKVTVETEADLVLKSCGLARSPPTSTCAAFITSVWT